MNIKGQDSSATGGYRPSAPVGPHARYVFFDGWPGHHYLYELYGDVPGAAFVKSDINQWAGQEGRDLSYLTRSLTSGIEAVVFLSLDPYALANIPGALLGFLRAQAGHRRVLGILHKPPQTPEHSARLVEILPHIRIIVLDELMAESIRAMEPAADVRCLPHHAVLGPLLGPKRQARERRSLPGDRVLVSLLGELRHGKGLDRLLDALEYLPDQVKRQAIFLVAGGAKAFEPELIRAAFVDAGVKALVVSERLEAGYKLVPDQLLADYVSASDLGLLLFEGPQQHCMSGILPNYVQAGVPVLASEDSLVGKLVKIHGLGWTADISNPKTLAKVLTEASDAIRQDHVPTMNSSYKMSISDQSVLEVLENLLQEAD